MACYGRRSTRRFDGIMAGPWRKWRTYEPPSAPTTRSAPGASERVSCGACCWSNAHMPRNRRRI